MQYQTPQHEIRKRPIMYPSDQLHRLPTNIFGSRTVVCVGGRGGGDVPLMADALELIFVLRVRLDPQTGGQDELANGGAEAGEEGVEWLWGRKWEGLAKAFLYFSVLLDWCPLFAILLLLNRSLVPFMYCVCYGSRCRSRFRSYVDFFSSFRGEGGVLRPPLYLLSPSLPCQSI